MKEMKNLKRVAQEELEKLDAKYANLSEFTAADAEMCPPTPAWPPASRWRWRSRCGSSRSRARCTVKSGRMTRLVCLVAVAGL